MMKRVLIVLFALLFASISFAVSPFFFKGYAHVNGSLAPNGTVITVYVNDASTPKNSVSIGQGLLYGVIPTGLYTIAAEANTGDNVTFRVNNISLIASNGTNTSAQRLGSIVVENFNLSVNKSADGSACAYDVGCTGGYCVHDLCRSSSTYCGDGFCDSGESSSTCSADCPASSSGGGGGGGAAAVSVTTTPVSIAAGTTQSIPIDATKTKDIAVAEITITAKETATSVSLTIKESSKPADAPVPVAATTGSVYKYIDITVSNIQSSAISAAKVKFKVPKSWLTSNNIDANTVKLNRNVGNSWTVLATKKISEDATDVTYESDTPGFSTFAITGEKLVATPKPTATPSATATPISTPSATPKPTATQAPADTGTSTPMLLVAALIIIIASAYFFVKSREKKQIWSSYPSV